MEIRIDEKLKEGFTLESPSGTRKNDGILTTINSLTTGLFRCTRWFNVRPGDIINFSCLMGTSNTDNAWIGLYRTDGTTEEKIQMLKSDTIDLKQVSFSYTVPYGETYEMYGIGFFSSNALLKIAKPHLELLQQNTFCSNIIAAGMINLNTSATNDNFVNYGFDSVTSENSYITITLSNKFISSSIRPVVVANNATSTSVTNNYILRCADMNYSSNKFSFRLALIDSSTGEIISPPANSFASFIVLY